MKLLFMRPKEIREAVKYAVPILLPMGSYEYHGPHLPLGTDTLIAEGLCNRIEEKCNVIIAPSIPFSPTMNWASGIEDGDLDFNSEALFLYVKEYLSKLLEMGFRKIYIMLGHQGKEGLPALITKKAFREILGDIAKKIGPGWGQLPYDSLPYKDIFSMVKICDYDEYSDYNSISCSEHLPVGHGGRGETQLIMALYDGLVKTEELKEMKKPFPEWLNDVYEADKENGAFWVDFCVNGWVKHFNVELF